MRRSRPLNAVVLSCTLTACVQADRPAGTEETSDDEPAATGRCVLQTWATIDLSTNAPEPFGTITAAAVLGDSLVVVGDRSARRITVFSGNGSFIGSFGRLGSGPGEFQSIDRVLVTGDTVFIVDERRRLYAAVSSGLELLRQASLPSFEAMYRVYAVLPRSLVVARRVSPTVRGKDGPEVWRESMQLHVINGDGTDNVILPTFADEARISDLTEGFSVLPLPFSHRPTISVIGDDVYLGTDAVIKRIGIATGDVQDLSVPWRAQPVTSDDVQHWTYDQLDNIDERGRQIARRMLSSVPLPDRKPLYGPIAATPVGIWVQEYLPPYSQAAPDLVLIDTVGSILTKSALLPRSRLMAASSSLVVAERSDSLGVQTVEVIPFVCGLEADSAISKQDPDEIGER